MLEHYRADRSLSERLLNLDDAVSSSSCSSVLEPYAKRVDAPYFAQFSKEYYATPGRRTLVLGINPGRKGSGLTGVPFTDGQSLAADCGIDNEFEGARELTSQFLYQVVRAAGGVRRFYARLCLSGIYPNCLVADGRNTNYYDLLEGAALKEFVAHSLAVHRELPNLSDHLVVIGQGRHLDLIQAANTQHGFFRTIGALPHPRFIMQYNRPRAEEYVAQYLSAFELQ
jgi:hypothetical protein